MANMFSQARQAMEMTKGYRSGLFAGFRNDSELLEETQEIGLGPLLGDLAIGKSIDEDSGVRDLLSSRGGTLKLALVCPFKAITHNNLVSLGNLIVDGLMQIRKGQTHAGNELPVLFYAL